MGDIDDFFAKKDKKKKGTKKFSKANTDVIAKNLIDSDRLDIIFSELKLDLFWFKHVCFCLILGLSGPGLESGQDSID